MILVDRTMQAEILCAGFQVQEFAKQHLGPSGSCLIKDIVIRKIRPVSHLARTWYSYLRIMAEVSTQPQIAIAEAIHLLQTFRGTT